VATKNVIIQQQQKLQGELEKALARKPGPEISEELNACQNDVRKKSKQMKAMASELNMHQAQVREYKNEIDRLATELLNFKRKYFEVKQREVERERELDELTAGSTVKPMRDQSNTKVRKFVGGVFAIK
jgi:chromosome segregation ATPase